MRFLLTHVFSHFCCRKELFFIRLRGFIVSSIYALFFTSSAIAGFISVTALLLAGIPLKSFQVFTFLSALANIRLVVTLCVGESLRHIVDAKTALDRVQRVIEKKSISLSSVSTNENPSTLKVYFRGRKYNPHPVRLDSFKSGKPAVIYARKLDETSQHSPSRYF